jgi:hypothetical protein
MQQKNQEAIIEASQMKRIQELSTFSNTDYRQKPIQKEHLLLQAILNR